MAIQDIYELSPIQQGMLSDSLAVKNSGLYLIQLSYALQGDLDITAFEQAWQRVVERHDVLRTSFHWEGMEKPAQVVHDKVALPFEMLDLSDLSDDAQTRELGARLQESRERGVEFTQPPLMRLCLFRLGENRFHFRWDFHHILFEGWSASVLLKEVFDIYGALLRGEKRELPPPKPYRDYIAWLRNQDMTEVEAFWRRELGAMTEPTPVGMGRGGKDTYGPIVAYDAEQLGLSEEETRQLKEFARQNRLTMNTLVQAAWALVLSLYSRENRVVYGSIVSGRSIALADVQSMVGLFINILPTRVVVDWRQNRLTWLTSLQGRQVEGRRFEFTPLVEVKSWSGIEPGIPLFESILVFENWLGEVSLNELAPGVTVAEVVGHNGAPGYPLAVVVEPGAALSLSITYDAERFDPETICAVLGHLRTILLRLAAEPEKPLSAIPFLTNEEETTLLRAWAGGQVPGQATSCLHARFDEAVAATPEAVAVVHGEQQLTYAELNARAERVAGYLQSLGVMPETGVGLCTERNLSMIAGLLAILKAGGVCVPLDPAYPEDRLRFMIQDSDLKVLLTETALNTVLQGCGTRTVCLDGDTPGFAEGTYVRPQVDGRNLAYIIYTSGSTGTPKGVMTPHAAAVDYVDAAIERFEITAADRILQFASISFDTAVEEIFPALLTGATLVLRSESMMDSMATFLRTCSEWRISVLDLPTAFWHEMVAALSAEHLEMPACLRLLIIGGESANPDQLAEWQARRGKKPRLFNTYGPTESTVVATMAELTNAPVDATRPVPIGRSIPNAEAYVLDRLLRPVPVGVAGELHIGGPGLARGYLARPDRTAEKFVPNPFGPEAGHRLYRTGDLVRYRNDGNLEFLGRVDDQVKVRGYRIEPGEIEAALRRHPAVSAAALIVEAGARLVAYVVPRPDAEVDAAELREFLRTQLPSFMLPQAFVLLQALPLTPSGKLDRRKLPKPGEVRAAGADGFVAPRTPVEKEIAAVWSELLKHEQIGVHDNFFELGGHSLLAIQLLSRLRCAFDVEIPLRRLFESPTVERLSIAIGESQIEKADEELMAQMLSEMEGLSDDEAQTLVRDDQ